MQLNEITILYVEDEKQSRRLLGLLLLDTFKEVYLASNGIEAIEIYKEKKIDLILSDVSMPIMDGIEMSIKIKEIKENQAIILLTASQNHKYLERAIEIGIYQYILKPIIDQKKFIKTLELVANLIAEPNKKTEIPTKQEFHLPTILYKAYKDKEFEIYYQPQFNATNNKYVGIDALLRWNNKEKIIHPNEFILGAIRVGLMLMIDDWVLEQSIKDITKLYKLGLNPGVISINLRMESLEQDNFINNLKDKVKRFDFKLELLEFKLREHDLVLADSKLLKKIKELSDMGIKISIANFGKGFISYIKKIPINKIKIHKSYIEGLPDREESILTVNAIIKLGEKLNIDIVAEGVEKGSQLKFLIKNKCPYIQGFLFSKPLSLNILIEDLKKRSN